MTREYPEVTHVRLLVTGGTGFLGQSVIRHALSAGAECVVSFSRSEEAQRQIKDEITDPQFTAWLGDVRDLDALREVIKTAGITAIVHAAAIKSVPLCEEFPLEAIKTNVDGSANVALAAKEAGITRVVAISTDKALNPSGVYGATKLATERLMAAFGFCSVRLGNLIGSTGSVLPIWKAQREAGEPIRITDPTMTRFFMSRHEAARFIAFALGASHLAEVFVPKLRACRMQELADAVTSEQTVIGLRPGERLHEALVLPDEPVEDYGYAYAIKRGSPAFGKTYRSDGAEAWNPDALLEAA